MFSTDPSHLRKYLTTLGVAIIAGTLSLAGLFFKIEQDLLMTNSEIAKLTPGAQHTIRQRQDYLEIGTRLLPWFVLIGVLVGLSLSIYGIHGWAERQRIADDREEAERDKVRAEVRVMTKSERADKLDREAAELSHARVEREEPPAQKVSMQPFSEFRNKVASIENELTKKLSSIFGSSVSPQMVARIGDQRYEVDALVNYPDNDDLSVVFEIKYSSRNNVRNRMNESLMRLARTATMFDAKAALMIVVPDTVESKWIDQWTAQAAELVSELREPPRVLIMRESEFFTISPSDFLARLNLPQPKFSRTW